MTQESLQPSRYILTDSVGVAARSGMEACNAMTSSCIARQVSWKYGLNYPDAKGDLSAVMS